MRRTFGILILVIAMVGFWAYGPRYLKAYALRVATPCALQLKQIDTAKTQWALEHNKGIRDTPTWKDLLPYFGGSPTNRLWVHGHPTCPAGGIYTLGRVGEPPRCSLGGKEPGHQLP